jgi:hypothetical protein
MKIKDFIMSIAIIIMTLFVIIYGFNAFYPQPEYSDFCGDRVFAQPIDEEMICPAVCVEMYEIKDDKCVLNTCGSGCGPDGVNTFEIFNHCEIVLSGEDCVDLYEEASVKYSRTLFLMIIPLGILIIASGVFLFNLESVGAGLMGGGVGTLIFGAGKYWRYADSWLKFLICFIGLVILILVAYQFDKKSENFRFFKKKK